MMDRKRVESKILLMLKYIHRLQEFESVTEEEYLNDFDLQLISERLIQLLVEAATDISSYLLVELHQVTPSTYVDSFILAGQNGIITQDLAATLSKSGGMRNRLVHNYDEINHKIVFFAISRALEEYSIYIRQVNNYLNSLEVNNG
ncbi:type VII toxin-antitoxin system HepT family RNase toxin [Laspinema olomoucense]|uniref:type VII toxin-antitoxin system HepT family RNase toxin n=1 Tax=Laspinema olomoucense TaxID=3231600 RepID=UPI0021BB68C6|nr:MULTISPECIES: DUF86 domain-containing protein [unclassified Laspinema]MCT7972745.1 DUF86 domain-containing protein [Laspinema sp. D3d]MCT7988323.1 DUF86 domain-containing protein [Laspinema sp. D3a]